ncbi:SPOR domain-containing protein [Desulforegula conservatrix]|uniref:SPOR domain-containing protein n=1 Tax=Desulforegula conservatrix TaxID=153026 RepID=UPI0004073730|nr:SPOR domain-containing protein [Desulforegula conservatrix]
MTIEFDRKEGTEPEFPGKKKKTVTLERRVIFGWWIFLTSVAAWMFYLGILVGRESAPVYFDSHQLDFDLMAMVSSAVNPESTDVVLPETTESQELEFFEALKDNKGGSKKIEELASLQSKAKLAALEPERLPSTSKAANKDSDKEEGVSKTPADSSDNGNASKSKSISPVKPGEKTVASAKEVKAAQEKTDKKTDVKKPEDKKTDDKKTVEIKTGDKKHTEIKTDASKTDTKKPEKEKTPGSVKKDSKPAVDTARNTQQKQDTKAASASDKTKDSKKQTDVKTIMQDIAAKKAEKPTDSVAVTTLDQLKNQTIAKEQPQKIVEPVKQEKPKEATATKAGAVKTENKTADKQTVNKEQSKPVKYSIQAGAYTTQNDADAYAKKLSGAGYSTSVVKGKGSDGKEWYRIRVGTYGDKQKAVKMAETIKGAGFPAMVINVPQE